MTGFTGNERFFVTRPADASGRTTDEPITLNEVVALAPEGGGSAAPLSASFVAEMNNDIDPVTGGAVVIGFLPDTYYDIGGHVLDGIPDDAGLELTLDNSEESYFTATEDGIWAFSGGFLLNQDATGYLRFEGLGSTDGVGDMIASPIIPLAQNHVRIANLSTTIAMAAGNRLGFRARIDNLTADPWTPQLYGELRVIRIA